MQTVTMMQKMNGNVIAMAEVTLEKMYTPHFQISAPVEDVFDIHLGLLKVFQENNLLNDTSHVASKRSTDLRGVPEYSAVDVSDLSYLSNEIESTWGNLTVKYFLPQMDEAAYMNLEAYVAEI